jgi:transcriptional regulator with PAS, ATPase and Fis domain
LLEYFIEYFARRKNKPRPHIESEIVERLKLYHFPGNVRELRNMVERALILSDNDILTTTDFPLTNNNWKSDESVTPGLDLLKNEFRLIKEAMNLSGYNQKNAANLLGISRDALIRRMKKFKITINKNISG